MTDKEKDFKHEYMGICVSDQEIIEYLEKENAELKEQIEVKKLEILNLKAKVEKMKNCENCKWNFVIGDYEPCNKCSYEKDNWELAK